MQKLKRYDKIIKKSDGGDGMPDGYFPQDCGAATQNILLEAASLGLGTCWCSIYPEKKELLRFVSFLVYLSTRFHLM